MDCGRVPSFDGLRTRLVCVVMLPLQPHGELVEPWLVGTVRGNWNVVPIQTVAEAAAAAPSFLR